MFYEIAASPKLPLTPFIPFSPARCREFWEALPSSLKNRAVEDAKALCPVVWPQILACDFLEYTRSGNRIGLRISSLPAGLPSEPWFWQKHVTIRELFWMIS